MGVGSSARLWTAAAAALAVACRSAPEPLVVVVAGCAELHESGVCELTRSSRELRVWLEGRDSTTVVTVDQQPVTPTVTAQPDGTLLRVTLPDGAEHLNIERAGATWSARVTASPCAHLKPARTLQRQGQPQAALDLLSGEASEGCSARAQSLRGRCHLALGHNREADRVLAGAAALHAGRGELNATMRDTLARAFILTFKERDLAAADRVLANLHADPSHGEARAEIPYYQGLLARERGDLRAALEHFARARHWASRLGLERLLVAETQALADTLLTLGRDSEAHQILDELWRERGASLGECDQVHLLTNLGWALLHTPGGDPEAAFRRGLEVSRAGCAQPALQANLMVNLALASLEAGRTREASRWVREVRAFELDAFVRAWLEDLTGRIALAENRAGEALAIFEATLAKAPLLSQERWRAMLGRGRALRSLGQYPEAVDALAAAEVLLDQQLRLVPLGSGRATFAGDRARGAIELVDLLVELGRFDEALDNARRSRARVLWLAYQIDRVAALEADARIAWQAGVDRFGELRRQCDQLGSDLLDAPVQERGALQHRLAELADQATRAIDAAYDALPRPNSEGLHHAAMGELLLVYHPTPVGWVAFAETPDGVEARRLSGTRGRALLEPFATQIAAARRILVLPYGELDHVDFHALAWRDGVLLDHAAVAYPLDLPTRQVHDAERGGRVLVVADARGNLRAAREESALVRSALQARGFQVDVLTAPVATRSAVLRGLSGARGLHFAGHAEVVGVEGWHSYLALSRGEILTTGDILALPRPPAEVVLAACNSARTSAAGQRRPAAVGLGHAFVAAGTEVVVASARTVQDADAAALARLLYNQAPGDLARAARAAQLQLRNTCAACDWAAFRTLVR